MSKTKVVFCDNDFLSRETIKILLKKIPYVDIVGEFENIVDLMNELERNDPDIVIFDLYTNNFNYLIGIKEILKVNPLGKVIVTSTFEDYKTIALAFNIGAIAFLAKRDLSVSDLTNAIVCSTKNKHYLSKCCEYKMDFINKMIQ